MFNSIERIFTKKHSLYFAAFGTLLFFLASYSVTIGLCDVENRSCWRFFESLQLLIGFFPVMLLMSLLIFNVQNNVHTFWIRFAFYWIPISVVFIAIAPSRGSILWTSPKETFAILFPALFFVISLVIILYKWGKSRNH